MVTIEENNPREIIKNSKNLKGSLVLKRIRGDEILYILKFVKREKKDQ